MVRNLDGYYFRVKRDGKYQNVCWSDMSSDEMRKQLEGRTVEWVSELCIGLGSTIKNIGDTFNIFGGE